MIFDENLQESKGQLNVKLRGSGQIINLSRMPDEFIDVLHDVLAEIEDPYTKLATWAYMFVGLSIDEIRERFIISEGQKVKYISREYIRQKIKGIYEEIYKKYTERYGTNTIATLYYNKYIHASTSGIQTEEIEEKIIKEDISDEIAGGTEEDTNDQKEEADPIQEEEQEEGIYTDTGNPPEWKDTEY